MSTRDLVAVLSGVICTTWPLQERRTTFNGKQSKLMSTQPVPLKWVSVARHSKTSDYWDQEMTQLTRMASSLAEGRLALKAKNSDYPLMAYATSASYSSFKRLDQTRWFTSVLISSRPRTCLLLILRLPLLHAVAPAKTEVTVAMESAYAVTASRASSAKISRREFQVSSSGSSWSPWSSLELLSSRTAQIESSKPGLTPASDWIVIKIKLVDSLRSMRMTPLTLAIVVAMVLVVLAALVTWTEDETGRELNYLSEYELVKDYILRREGWRRIIRIASPFITTFAKQFNNF